MNDSRTIDNHKILSLLCCRMHLIEKKKNINKQQINIYYRFAHQKYTKQNQ